MLDALANIGPLLLAILGFGALIFVHELGHFLAARWAGVRVHEFAMGFGPAICSWRKGLGFRRGSTAREYLRLLEQRGEGGEPARPETRAIPGVSPTEYRLNWVPFGGYVKMLGQEDLDPSATSSLRDSYTSKPIWKRMVIISAGIVMNVLVAAALFVVVFTVGLPAGAPVVGAVFSPPAKASGASSGAADADGQAGAQAALPGREGAQARQLLRPGDRILRVNGSSVRSFNDVIVAVAMAPKDEPVEIVVNREGQSKPVTIRQTPWLDPATKLLDIGAMPAFSATLAAPASSADRQVFDDMLAQAGLSGLPPGAAIVEMNGEKVEGFWDIKRLAAASAGEPMRLAIAAPKARERLVRTLTPRPELQLAVVRLGEDRKTVIEVSHLLGFTPAVRLIGVTPRARAFGLRVGDVIAGVDGVSWPDRATLIERIRARAGGPISLIAMRDGRMIEIDASVRSDGLVGFTPGSALWDSSRITTPPPDAPRRAALHDAAGEPLAAARLALPPGSIIEAVEGAPVANFAELRAALRSATQEARSAGGGADVALAVRLPFETAQQSLVPATLSLSAAEVAALHALTWVSPLPAAIFEPLMTSLRASDPLNALAMGVFETRRVILMTYLTLLRLAQGSVQVQHLKGPVGIAEIGTKVARSGLVQLLFFLAVISANLAVINFLPLPIVDGGLFLMLLYEQIRGRPLPIVAQNMLTLAGLALIGAVFLIVTFNDVMSLLR